MNNFEGFYTFIPECLGLTYCLTLQGDNIFLNHIVKLRVILTSSTVLIYLFGVLRRFQHCTGHITTGSWKGRGNRYIQLVKVLLCKLLTNSNQL